MSVLLLCRIFVQYLPSCTSIVDTRPLDNRVWPLETEGPPYFPED